MCVLLVEDEELIRLILVEELTYEGFEVCPAANGQEAEAMLDHLATEPTLLVTDVHMPGKVDGIALAQEVEARWPGLPVIFITGLPGALNRLGGLDQRKALLRKPFRPSELVAVARKLLSALP